MALRSQLTGRPVPKRELVNVADAASDCWRKPSQGQGLRMSILIQV